MIILYLNPHTLPTKFACMCATKTKRRFNVIKDFILAIISLRCNTVTMANLQTCLWPAKYIMGKSEFLKKKTRFMHLLCV